MAAGFHEPTGVHILPDVVEIGELVATIRIDLVLAVVVTEATAISEGAPAAHHSAAGTEESDAWRAGLPLGGFVDARRRRRKSPRIDVPLWVLALWGTPPAADPQDALRHLCTEDPGSRLLGIFQEPLDVPCEGGVRGNGGLGPATD